MVSIMVVHESCRITATRKFSKRKEDEIKMTNSRSKLISIFILSLILVMVIVSCAPATTIETVEVEKTVEVG